ncbi:MAG: glucose-6-phosphate dehydrogenase [Candidatus Babeliales bacterium]
MNDCTFIILGMSGDLARRKLIPAIYELVKNGQLKKFAIVGAAHDQHTLADIFSSARNYIENIDESIWQQCCLQGEYIALDFGDTAKFSVLARLVDDVQARYQLSSNRLVYLATAAHFFASLTENLAHAGIIKKGLDGNNGGVWHRVVYEKPFGLNLASACDINRSIEKYLDESQIYRVDHYLAKELVSNITLVRFTNRIFEPLWNHENIDSIQIILTETLGVENRGSYYDKFGALQDVVQNHAMQLLALVAMEAPNYLSGDYIRDEKAAVLKKVEYVNGVLGQYAGYKKEQGVASDSQTETFAALHLRVNNQRWKGVPFYVKVGKCLNVKKTKIVICFKHIECLLLQGCPTEPNYLTIEVAPDEGFSIELNAKKPGALLDITPVTMAFKHRHFFGATPVAYEVILEEVIKGEQSISVRADEIEDAWNVIDQVERAGLKRYSYVCGSGGPKELELFQEQNSMRFRV